MESEEWGDGSAATTVEEGTGLPFQPAEEAAMLLDLAGQLLPAASMKSAQIQAMASKNDCSPACLVSICSELEHAKRNLMKRREEGIAMAAFLLSLREELDSIRTEVMQLREREPQQLDFGYAVEIGMPPLPDRRMPQRKRCVTFASPTSATAEHGAALGGRKKKKAFIPLLGVLFGKIKCGTSYGH